MVEFRNVSFRYPDAEENVLCNINFTAKPGETTAIIGSTGSGKSTVVNLIPRFFDVTDGAIYVDGADVREVTQSDLRDRIGYIPQQGMLFSGTVESNLRYADENASEEDPALHAEIAQASILSRKWKPACRQRFHKVVPMSLADRNSVWPLPVPWLRSRRSTFSTTRLSALDFKTDAALRKALKAETGDSTMIIVTQRVITIKNAEQIIVLMTANRREGYT